MRERQSQLKFRKIPPNLHNLGHEQSINAHSASSDMGCTNADWIEWTINIDQHQPISTLHGLNTVHLIHHRGRHSPWNPIIDEQNPEDRRKGDQRMWSPSRETEAIEETCLGSRIAGGMRSPNSSGTVCLSPLRTVSATVLPAEVVRASHLRDGV